MTTSNLDRIVEEVKALTPDEQRALREMLESSVTPAQPDVSSSGFQKRLLERGIISRIPPRIRDAEFYANRKPIAVEGKPVSEIIIEERR
ncbi:MAG: hypothetical protein AABO41_02350 [Acidobacteriota bacterium]